MAERIGSFLATTGDEPAATATHEIQNGPCESPIAPASQSLRFESFRPQALQNLRLLDLSRVESSLQPEIAAIEIAPSIPLDHQSSQAEEG